MTINERFNGSILGGAIGDAYGSAYENIVQEKYNEITYFPFGKPEKQIAKWQITDDTQLTLATCEVIFENKNIEASLFAKRYLQYFKANRIIGMGASTTKAFQELEVGGHWYLVGRKGEYAAGNGAAMRIAPLGFVKNVSRSLIKDVCYITHQNDEAYVGALCIVIAIQSIISNKWTGKENLIEIIIDEIPDTKVRDRLIEINKLNGDLYAIGKLGTTGYVVDSIPLAIAFASNINELGMRNMYKQLIELGGDTDTNCSIAGQIAGALIGESAIPKDLKDKLRAVKDYDWISRILNKSLNYPF